MHRNRFLIFVATLFCLSCTKNEKSDPNTLFVGLAAEPNSLDPRQASDANGMRICSLLFNSLVRVGPDLKVVPDAAESWTYKNKTYHFVLKPNLKFTGGREVTPEDLEFTFDEFRGEGSKFKASFSEVSGVKARKNSQGRLELEISMKSFKANFLSGDLPVAKILPKAETLAAGADFTKKPMGTGPYELRNRTDTEIQLNAREDHPSGAPQTPHLVFKIVRDDFTRYQKMLNGSLDLIQSDLPRSKIKDFEKRSDEFTVHKYLGLSMNYILLNLEDPWLKKLEFRQALAMAVNREDIITYKLEGLAEVASSIMTPGNPYFAPMLKNLSFDPEQSRKKLEDLGAQKVKFTIKTSNAQEAVENGQVLLNQMRAVGLDVGLQSFEWGTYYGDITKGNFQLATMKWVGATDPDIYRLAFHSAEVPPGRNRGRYINRALDALLVAGPQIEDENKRREHYFKIQKIVLEDLPIIPLWYDHQVAVVNKRIKGYQVSLNGDFSPLLSLRKE